MKTQSKFLVTLNQTEINQLTKETKETVATNYTEHKTVFCAADLWNIQKTRRSFKTKSSVMAVDWRSMTMGNVFMIHSSVDGARWILWLIACGDGRLTRMALISSTVHRSGWNGTFRSG